MPIPQPNPTRTYSEEAAFLFAMDCMRSFCETVLVCDARTRMLYIKGGAITEDQIRTVVGRVLRTQMDRLQEA